MMYDRDNIMIRNCKSWEIVYVEGHKSAKNYLSGTNSNLI